MAEIAEGAVLQPDGRLLMLMGKAKLHLFAYLLCVSYVMLYLCYIYSLAEVTKKLQLSILERVMRQQIILPKLYKLYTHITLVPLALHFPLLTDKIRNM